MIDYFCRWATIDDAKADAARLRKYLGDNTVTGSPPQWRQWYLNHFIPDVKAWRISQDVIIPASPPRTPPRVQHTYLAGWFGLLALDEAIPALYNDAACQFCLNRDFIAGVSPPNIVVKNNIGAVLQDVGVEPTFAGSHYPLGGL